MNAKYAVESMHPEKLLVNAAMQGDVEAFNQLIPIYQDQVFQLTSWILKDQFQAEDITQNTFLNAYLKIGQFRGGSFKAWLFRIAYNACFDELRRQKRRQKMVSSMDFEEEIQDGYLWTSGAPMTVEQRVEKNEFNRFIEKCIDDIPVKYRSPVIMIDLLDMNYQETAEALGIPLGTLKSRLTRGRLMLVNQLKASNVYYHEATAHFRQEQDFVQAS
jgi:RNA polymerase sigma-70 factor, ECF subfamily